MSTLDVLTPESSVAREGTTTRSPTWLVAQRFNVLERLAVLPEETRRSVLSMKLSPVEERAVAYLLEHGHVEDRWMEVIADAVVLDERVIAACQAGAADAGESETFPLWTELGAAAVDLEAELNQGEARASAAGWSSLAARARLSQLRVQAVRERLRPYLPVITRRAAVGDTHAAAAWRHRNRAGRIVALALPLVLVTVSLLSLYRASRAVEPDAHEAIGAEDFADLLHFDRIVVDGPRLAAVIRGWELMPEGDRQVTVDQVCARLRARNFETAWLYDQSARVVAECDHKENES